MLPRVIAERTVSKWPTLNSDKSSWLNYADDAVLHHSLEEQALRSRYFVASRFHAVALGALRGDALNKHIRDLLLNELSKITRQADQLPQIGNAELTSVEDACAAFVHKAKMIAGVAEVLLEKRADDDATIWTLISAPPFERTVRFKVYDAQIDVLRGLSAPVVGFQLVNLLELPDTEMIDQILPPKTTILWRA